MPVSGGAATGPLTATQLGAVYQVDQFAGADFGAKLQACINALNTATGGTCDARNFPATVSLASNLTIATANATVLLPCSTINAASQIVIPVGTRNVSLRGCTLRGTSNASGSAGGTVLMYSGSASMIQVGDPTYTADTQGFHLDNVAINTTSGTATAQAIVAFRTQEMDIESIYLLGNTNQTGMTLDGTGNYTGGTFYDNAISGYQTALNAIGHQVANAATTDWLNASTFLRLHINCPTSNGNPIAGTTGINLAQGDGNTITGGDVEGCATALHLGPNAQNNTIVGLRNENSSNQVVADAGSSYNNWITGGTMFTGKLTDNGTRNSFLDTFHRSFNGMTGDWYGSQQDATVTNHYRLGIGSGNERGLYNRYQTDAGYRWTTGLSDASAGEQFYQVLDELNNVYRLSIGQYNPGQSSSNNQTVVNAAGTGAVVLNGSNNSGTGGVVFGSGGPNETTVATINNAGNAQFNGTLQVSGPSTFTSSTTVRNSADAEIDQFLWAGATANQKESFIYKDYTGASQWYMVKDAANNWALNSAPGGLDSFKAYQSTNSGDTYVNASNASGVVRVNYENGSGSQFKVYGGNSGVLYASLSGANAIQFPGLASSSGKNCLQIDNSGYLSNTGTACGTGTGGSGTVNSGSSGQIAYYNANGTAVSGMNAVPVTAGGTGATTAAAALSALGAASLVASSNQNFAGPVAAPSLNASVNSQINVMAAPYNAKGDCTTDDQAAIQSAINAAGTFNPPAVVYFPKPAGGCYLTSTITWNGASLEGQPSIGITPATGTAGVILRGKPGQDILHVSDPSAVSTAAPARSWSIRDLVFQVDDSIDASASFAHRWPGRWFNDAAMTAGSAQFTSTNANVSCGDIGQNILVKGAGAAGADLSTTISSVSPCTGHRTRTITLAAAASTSVASAAAYITPLNLPLNATIGNCSIAMDNRDGNPANWTMTGNPSNQYDTLWNATFTSVSGTAKNNSCGIYTQGIWGMYGLDARNISVARTVWGLVQGAPEIDSWYQSDANDFQLWDHGLWSLTTYPWISYNGGYNALKHIQLATTFGPQILTLGNRWGDNVSGWTINAPEFETNTGGTGWRIEGRQNLIENTALTGTGGTSPIAYFDTDDTVCNNCSVFGHLVINGMQNDIRLGGDISTYTMDVTDRGIGNSVTGAYSSNPQSGADNTRYAALNITRGPSPAGVQTADFVRTGNVASPYFNDLDLFFWPADFVLGASSPAPVTDSASLTGAYFTWANSSTISNFANLALFNGRATNTGNTLLISNSAAGGNVPATKVTAYASAKCATASTVEFDVYAGSTLVASATPACSTGYTTLSVPADLSAFAGQNLGFRFYSASGSPMVAWIALRPFQADYNGRQPVLANVALSTTGSGSAVPTGPTTSTSGNITTFTGTQGQIQDSGIALNSIPSLIAAGTQTFAASLAAPSVNNVTEASQYPNLAAAVAATPAGGRIHLASSYSAGLTSTLNITNPITFQCDSGATIQRQTGTAAVAVNITANNVVFDGCTFDDNSAGWTGVMVGMAVRPGVTGFQFRNGSFINVGDYGLGLYGTINTVIDNNLFQAVANGNAWGAGIAATGSTSQITKNLKITNNRFQPADVNIQSQQCTNCGTDTFIFSHNTGTPTPGPQSMLLQVQDTSWDQSGGIGNFTVVGNVCKVSAATKSAAPFGCFSIGSNISNCTISGNTLNASGQFLDDSLLELGTTNCTVANNTFIAGNDPGAQSYSDIIAYGGSNTFSGNSISGVSAYGTALQIYAMQNSDNNTVSGGTIDAGGAFAAQIYSQTPGSGYSGSGTCTVNGGTFSAPATCSATVNNGGLVFTITYGGRYTTPPTSITTSFATAGTPATVTVGAANATAGIGAVCNMNANSLRARITSVSGNGTSGPVASLAINQGSGNPLQGRGWVVSSGNTVSGGSGSGLKLDITSVDANGTVLAVAPTPGSAGDGYKPGDFVALSASGSAQVGSLLNMNIGGGLTISGALAKGINVQSTTGAPLCPVSVDISNISISGPSANTPIPTGVYGYRSTIAEGKIRFTNVTTPNVNNGNSVTYEKISLANPVATPSLSLTNLTPSGNKLCALGGDGALTNVGCDLANGSTFTPTAIGWYRILSATANQIAGSIDILTSNYDGHEIHDRFDFVGSGNGATSVLNASQLSSYAGSYGPIDQVEVSGNNSTGIYVDVHVNDIASPQPITITYGGQSLPQSAVIAAPVVGSVPGAYSTAIINLAALSTSPQVTRKTTGLEEASSVNAITGYQVNGTALAAAHLSNGTTGSGNVVLANGPTFKGNSTLFANGAAAEQDIVLQPGSAADQVGAVQYNNYNGVAQWKLRKDASNYLRLTDSVNSLDRAVLYQNGQTILNAGAGSNAVVLNGTANSGTGGLLVQNGGASPATVLTVTGSGNTTATGFIAGKSMAGTGSMTLAAGAAAGTSPTLACATSHLCDSVSGEMTLTTGSSPTTGLLATLTFPSSHTNYANCIVNVASSTAQVSSVTWTDNATALTLTANSALTASTPYQIRYWCGGN